MSDKAAAYDRNIIAAENAMKQAKADHDTDAYNRALFVLGWATEGLEKLTRAASPLEEEDHYAAKTLRH